MKKVLVFLLVFVMLLYSASSASAFAPKGVEVVEITEVPGFAFGTWTDRPNMTGTTVICCTEPGGATGGVSVLGGSPGTRETDLLEAEKTVQIISACVLSGGSAFGLDACSGAMKFMEEKGLGVPVGVTVVPIVTGAVIFDLGRGDDGRDGVKENRPGLDAGYQACVNAFAGVPFKNGNNGAGMGASAGGAKGGMGSYCYKYGDLYVGAVVIVNSAGQVVDPETGKILAGRIDPETNSFIDRETAIVESAEAPRSGQNTTIGCIVTNAQLTQANANKLAEMAHDAFARAIEPTHQPSDGDCIYAMASGKAATSSTTWGQASANMSLIGVLAVNAMERAIVSAVVNAETVSGTFKATGAAYNYNGYATMYRNGTLPAQPEGKSKPAIEEIKIDPAVKADVQGSAAVYYVVQPGDWLSTIAAKFGTTYQAIAEANNILDPNLIVVGQRLIIPQ